MLIQQKLDGSKGSFYFEEDGIGLAEMTFSLAGTELMIIDHTEVSDALSGKNVGYQLLKTSVEYARANNMKILPLCPFAKAMMEKRIDEFGDVLRRN